MNHLLRLSRRDLLVASAGLGALALAPSLAFAQAKIDNSDMFAPDALPDVAEGKDDAPVTIVEYASLTCPHCAVFHNETYPALKKNYIETGKVRFIFREFPLDALAAAASMLARCSGDKRNAATDLLFAQQKNWAYVDKPLDALEATMKQTGMSADAFKKCLDDKELYQNVMKVRQRGAEKFGIDSTPTFFINGVRRVGEITVADLDKLLAPYLDKK